MTTNSRGVRTRSGQTTAVETTAIEGGDIEWLSRNCPILASTAKITGLAQDLQRSMRQLRRDLNHCETCPARQHCPVLQDYQDQISQAITAVLAEFSDQPSDVETQDIASLQSTQ